jgi:putative ABC transport system substrate-binding protein
VTREAKVVRPKRKSMNKELFCLSLTILLLAFSFPIQAQELGKAARIGYLSAGTGSTGVHGAFRQALRELGYIEGKNITIEFRSAGGMYERLHDLATELVRLKVDMIFAPSTLAARSAKEATRSIPIVMYSGDPVGAELVASLARPGGNVTGVTNLSPDLSTKRLELVKETVPRAALVAVLWDPDGPVPVRAFKETETAARGLGINILSVEIRSPEPDLRGAFQIAAKKHAGALIVVSNPLTTSYRKEIVELANRNRIPGMYPGGAWMDHGALMAYGVVDNDLYRRAGVFVDKILRGAKPADLPVEQPTKFEFVINLKAAKQLGLTIPQRVLQRADRVIK